MSPETLRKQPFGAEPLQRNGTADGEFRTPLKTELIRG